MTRSRWCLETVGASEATLPNVLDTRLPLPAPRPAGVWQWQHLQPSLLRGKQYSLNSEFKKNFDLTSNADLFMFKPIYPFFVNCPFRSFAHITWACDLFPVWFPGVLYKFGRLIFCNFFLVCHFLLTLPVVFMPGSVVYIWTCQSLGVKSISGFQCCVEAWLHPDFFKYLFIEK